MVFHMKTTLIIPDPIFRELKKRAVERGETMSNLVTEFLRRGLKGAAASAEIPPLPAFHMGNPRVDISDRDAVYGVLDAERDARLYSPADEE